MSESIIVIGSGPGGYKSAVMAAERGMEVLLIEKGDIGGVCTNRGCIPSKALLSVSESIDTIENARRKGISASLDGIDMKKVQRFKGTAVKTSQKGIEKQLKDAGVEVVKGEAEVVSNSSVKVGDDTYSADNIIIATGSEPIQLPFLEIDEENIISSKGALELEEIPETMAIIGGGYIGLEMAAVFSSFGTEVTIIEMMPRLLPVMDNSLSELAEQMLKRRRVNFYTDTKVEDVKGVDPSILTLSNGTEIKAEKVLCSVGRRTVLPNTKLEITDEKGKVVTDDFMKTPVDGVYAVGDVNGKSMLAHSAYKQAEIAVKHILGEDVRGFSEYLVPSGVFTHPELASIGLSEDEARETYGEVSVGMYPISANGRGYSTGERMGFAKVISVEDKLVGVHMACPGATDIIMEGALGIELKAVIQDIIDIIHPHPTYSEAFLDSLKDSSS